MVQYETVIGLEVHVELATESKIFCGCSTKFGQEPNTSVCPVCTGMPGTLPVLNKEAVNLAIRAGLGLNCRINQKNVFDRKNYFYPDLPKAYQISQLYLPICEEGELEITGKKIGIKEIHMEEDAGKLIHDPWDDCTLVDYNRCGVPLIEIVSQPDFSTADEVIEYLEKLREILIYLGISDCKMQEGSMRADINLSVRPVGQAEYGTRTEIKNMNSFKAIHRAVISESKRQIELIEDGGRVVQETRRWDDNKDNSFSMRSKEDAQDYRYFPEPDILPVVIDDSWILRVKQTLPETAEAKRIRFVDDMGLTVYDAEVITANKELCDLFEEGAALCGSPKECANTITGEIMRLVKDSGSEDFCGFITGAKIAVLIKMLEQGKINRTVFKEVLETAYKEEIDPVKYIEEKGLMVISDTGLIAETVKKVIQENPQSVSDFLSGKEKAFGFMVGQCMKLLKGKGDPKTVNELLREELKSI